MSAQTTESRSPVAEELAVAVLRTQLATFLHALSAVPGSPQAVVLRGRAEELSAAVAVPVPDPVEIERRWRRLCDAVALFGASGPELADISSTSAFAPR